MMLLFCPQCECDRHATLIEGIWRCIVCRFKIKSFIEREEVPNA